MLFKRKKSFITDWWIAKRNDVMRFVDITDERNLTKDVVVVGRSFAPIPEYINSHHPVVKVTTKGIYTASGRFYSFNKAHPMYLLFLREIHLPMDAIIASKWRCINNETNQYVANLDYPSREQKNQITFDFCSIKSYGQDFVGFSDVLDDVVVFNPFDWFNSSETRYIKSGIPTSVYWLSFKLEPYRRNAIKDIRRYMRRQKKK